MPTPAEAPSLLSPIGYRNNSCGYCHRKSGSLSYFASTTSCQPLFYQSLLNRGWRRSGTLLYKPDQRASCCPQYTIRLDAHSFHASKDQRQAVNRFSRYILGDTYTKDATRLHPRSRDQTKKRDTDFDLLERVHESEKERLPTPPDPSHDFQVTLESNDFTEEKYAVFQNYQRIVHREPPHRISRSGFDNFLCSSPLPPSTETLDGRTRRLGSYHQCYRIDGKLVAVGVLDLLPQCVSAVYFMYHESVHTMSFGKLGALREIALAKEDGYRWWYAGFYIHSCAKMRYKVDYTPQYILDAASYGWDRLDEEMRRKLDERKFVCLSLESPESSSSSSSSTSARGAAQAQSRQAAATADPMGKQNGEDPEDRVEEEDDDIDEDENDGYDSADDSPVPDPTLPLFSRSMPGILTRQQLLRDIDLDRIGLRIRGREAETGDVVIWEQSSIDNPNSIKGIIADLVAAVGVELAREMTVTFD